MSTYFTRIVTPRDKLIAYGRWLQSRGWWVWEHSQFYKSEFGPPGTYRVNPVHAAKSFHKGDLALDINWPNAAQERHKILTEAIPMAKRLGISYIYAEKGTMGSAKYHQGHLHVDAGTSTNDGSRYIYNPGKNVDYKKILGISQKKRKPNSVYANRNRKNPALTQVIQLILRWYNKRLAVDGKYGPETERYVKIWQSGLKGVTADGKVGPQTIRRYLERSGTLRVGSTGNPVRVVQYIVGVKRDGKYGPATAEAVKECQRWAGITADGIFGAQSRARLLI